MSSITPQPQETRSHLSATTLLPMATPSNAPAIVSRFTARKHCNSDAVVASVREYFTVNWPWTGAEEQEKFVKQDLELAGPFFYPDALDDRIELATLLFTLCFLIDDILDQWDYEQAKAFFKKFQGLVFGTSTPTAENKVEAILAEICTRIRGTDEGSYLTTNLFKEICTWFAAATQNGRSNEAKNLESYLEYRVVDAGYWTALALLRWVCDIPVPEHMRKDPSFQLIEVTAGFHGPLINDMYSYQRETSAMQQKEAGEISKSMVNAVAFVMEEKEMNEQDARRYLKKYVSDLEEKFVIAVANAKGCYSGQDLKIFEKYVNGLEMLCSGNLQWSTFCGRYNHQ